MTKCACNTCGASAVHATDAQAWDDIIHAFGCTNDEFTFAEADSLGLCFVLIAA